ncbi:MAG: acyltransferase family protein [Bacteroidales bacterium]|nr:acyltransferase family protein [Bacteroidales bacterium]
MTNSSAPAPTVKNDMISMARAVCIVLMVLGHTGYSKYGIQFTHLFNMPLFFITAGFCFKEKYLTDAMPFVRRRFKGLYVPFVKWGLVFLLAHNLFFRLNLYNAKYSYEGNAHLYDIPEMLDHFWRLLIQMNFGETLLGAYWFFPVLLFGSLVAYVLIRFLKKPWLAAGFALILAGTASHFGWHLPFGSIDKRCFLGACLFVCGYGYRLSGLQLERRWMVVATGMAITAVISVLFPVDMQSFSCSTLLQYVLAAGCGALAVFALGRWLASYRCPAMLQHAMRLVGKHTMPIVTFHFLCFKLVNYCIIQTAGLSLDRLAEYPIISAYSKAGWWPVYLLVGLALPILGASLVEAVRTKGRNLLVKDSVTR